MANEYNIHYDKKMSRARKTGDTENANLQKIHECHGYTLQIP